MEEIEYLEEYEDLVLPAVNAPQSTANVDDEGSSSSLDQDIFNCLFDDNSDDDNDDQQSKNDETNLYYKGTSRPSLDSIDLLNDLGEQVAKEFELKKDVASQQSQKTYNSTKIETKAQPKASSKLRPKASSVRISATTASLPVNHTAQTIVNTKSVATVRPTVKNKELLKKSGIVKESSTQQQKTHHSTSFALSTTSKANATTSTLLHGRSRKIFESGTSSLPSSSIVKKSTTALPLKSSVIKQRPATIVKPEKILTKDPPEDPLNLEDLSSAESANYSVSDISGETYNSISDFDEDDYDFTSHIENLDEDDDDSSNSQIIDISNDSSVSRSQFEDLRASTPSPVVSDDRDLSSTPCFFNQRSSSPKFMANHAIIKCLLTKGEKPKLLQLINEHDTTDNTDITDRKSSTNTQPRKTTVGQGTVGSLPNELSNEKDKKCITFTPALKNNSTNTKEHEDSSATCVTNMDYSNNSRDTQSPGTISHDSYLSVVNEMLEESYAEAMKNSKQDGLPNQEVGAEMEIGVDEITEVYLVPEVDVSKESSNLEDEKKHTEKLLEEQYPVGAKLNVLDAEKPSETNKGMDTTENLNFKANESTKEFEEQVSVDDKNEHGAKNKSDVNMKATEASKKRFKNETKVDDREFREEVLDDEDGFQGFHEEITQNVNSNISKTVQTEDFTDCYTNVKKIEIKPIVGNQRTCNDEQGATTSKVNVKKYASETFKNPTKTNDKSKEEEKSSHKNRLRETLIDRSKDTFSSKIKLDGPRSAIRNPFVQRTANKNLKIEESTTTSKDRSQEKWGEDRSREKSGDRYTDNGSNSKIGINEEIPATKELINIKDSKEFKRSDDVGNIKHSKTSIDTEKKMPEIESKAVENSCKDIHSKEDKLMFPLHKECKEQRTSNKNSDSTSKGIAPDLDADKHKDIVKSTKYNNQLSIQSSHEISKDRKEYNKSFDSTEKPSKVPSNNSVHCEENKDVLKLCGKTSDLSETMATLNEPNAKKSSIEVPNVLPQSTKMGTCAKSLKGKKSTHSEIGVDLLQSSNESKYIRIDNTDLDVSKTPLKKKQTSIQSTNAITTSSYSDKSQTPLKKNQKYLNKSRTDTNIKIKCIGQNPENLLFEQESLRRPGSKRTELKTRSTKFKDKGQVRSAFEKVKQQKGYKNTKIISEKNEDTQVVKVILKEERKPKETNVEISRKVKEIEANRSETETHQGNTVKDANKVKEMDTESITDNIVDSTSSEIREALYEHQTSTKTEDMPLQGKTTNYVEAANEIATRKQESETAENTHCSDKAELLETPESETAEIDISHKPEETTKQIVSAKPMKLRNTGENSTKLDETIFKPQFEISIRDPQEVTVEEDNIVKDKLNEEIAVRSTENNKRKEEFMDLKKFHISESVTEYCHQIEEHNKNEIDEKTISTGNQVATKSTQDITRTGEISTNNTNIIEELDFNLDNNNATDSTGKEKPENTEKGNQKQKSEDATHVIRKTRNTINNPKSSLDESSFAAVKSPEIESGTALSNIEDETETNYPQVSNMKTRSTKLDDSDTFAVNPGKEIIEYKKDVRLFTTLKKINTKPIPHSSKPQELFQKNALLLASKSPQINTKNISIEKPSTNLAEKSKISNVQTEDFENNLNWSSDVSKDCGVPTSQTGMRKTRSAHVHDDITDEWSVMYESISDVSNRGRTLRKRGTESPFAANGANKEPFKQPTKVFCPVQVSPMSHLEINMKRRLRSPASENATQSPLVKRSKTDSIPEDKIIPDDNGKCKVMETSTDSYKNMYSYKKVNHVDRNKGKQSPDKHKSEAVSSPEKSPSCTVLSFAEWLKNNNKKEAAQEQKPCESQPNIEEPKVRKRPNRPTSNTHQYDTKKTADIETKKHIAVPVAVELSQTSSKERAPLNCDISKNRNTSNSNQSNYAIHNTSETERIQNLGRVSLPQKVSGIKCNTHASAGKDAAQMNEDKPGMNAVSQNKSASTRENVISAEYTKDDKGDLSEVPNSPTTTSRGKTKKRKQAIRNKGITKPKLRVTQKIIVNRSTTLSPTKQEKSKCKRSETDILIESMSKEMKDGGIEDLLNNSNHVKRHRISSKRTTQAELAISSSNSTSDVSFADKAINETAMVIDFSEMDSNKMPDGGISYKSPIKRTQAQEKTRKSFVSKDTNKDFIQKPLLSIEMEKALIDEIEIKNMNTSLLEPLKCGPLKEQQDGTRIKTCPFKTPKTPEQAVTSTSTNLGKIQSAEDIPQLIYNDVSKKTESNAMNTSTTTKHALLFKCRMLKVRLNRSLVKKYWQHLKKANTPQPLSLTEVESNSTKNRRKVQCPLRDDIVKSTGIENNNETRDSSAHIPPDNHKLTTEGSKNGKAMPIQTSRSGEITNILLRTTNADITEESRTRTVPFADIVSEPVIPVEFKNEFLDENPSSLDDTILPDTSTLIARAHSVTQAAASALSNAIMPTDIRLLTNDPMSTSTYVPSFGVTPTLVDARGTRMYTFLHPAKYSRNHGNVLLDYCCPNLDGPMPAIDPTRIHAQIQTPVVELPAFIVLTTKVITRAELDNNSSTIPAIIRKKAEKLRSSIAIHHSMSASPGTKINVVPSSPSPPQTSQLQQTPQLQLTPQSVLHVMRPPHIAPAPHFSPALNALTKYLPSTTTITAKIRPPLPHPSLPLSLHHPNSNQQTSTVSVIAKGAPLLNEIQVNLLRSNLRRFDVIFKKLVQPFDILNFTERHQIIDNLVMSGKFLPKDLDRTIVLMEEYSKQINSIQRHQLPTSNSYKMPVPAAASPLTNLPSIQMPPLQPAPNRSSYKCTSSQQQVRNTAIRKMQATMKQNTTVNTTTIKQRQVPIYDTERNIIGYQLQVLTPPSMPAYTKSPASGGTMSSSLDTSSCNQRKGVKRPAQDSPRVFYTSQPLEASTPKANLNPLQYTATPLATNKNKQAIAKSQKGSIVTTVRSAGPTSTGTETITTTTMATVKRVTRSRAAGSKIIIVSKSNSNEESILPDVSHQTEIKNENDVEDFVG